MRARDITQIMDELTTNIQDRFSWCMRLANGIMLNDETSGGINLQVELWKNI